MRERVSSWTPLCVTEGKTSGKLARRLKARLAVLRKEKKNDTHFVHIPKGFKGNFARFQIGTLMYSEKKYTNKMTA